MTQAEYRAAIKVDFADDALVTDARADRAIDIAVSDLSRYFPRELIHDYTVLYDYDDEAFTSDESAWVTLSHPMIDAGSEVVKDSTKTTTYTRDTDYYMDYANGKIYTLTSAAGGSMGEATCYISYETIRVAIDLSSTGADIASSLVRVTKVEYPVGEVPQSQLSFSLYGDTLFVTSSEKESQARLTEKKHVWVHYLAEHTVPGASAGTYPAFLDEVVVVGSQAYTSVILSNYFISQAKENLVHALAELAGVVTEAEAAGDRVAGVTTQLTSANAALAKVATQVTAASAFWDAGDNFINTVTLGGKNEEVPRTYLDYGMAEVRSAEAFIAEAQQRVNAGNMLVAETAAMIQANSSVMVAVDGWFTAAGRDIDVADRYRSYADKKFADFYRLLEDRQQWMRNRVSTPVSQGRY